jgi:hypothetical protein
MKIAYFIYQSGTQTNGSLISGSLLLEGHRPPQPL